MGENSTYNNNQMEKWSLNFKAKYETEKQAWI